MAIDSMLDMSEKEGAVDIFGYVTQMRSCRPSMVQTEVGYPTLSDLFLHLVLSGLKRCQTK